MTIHTVCSHGDECAVAYCVLSIEVDDGEPDPVECPGCGGEMADGVGLCESCIDDTAANMLHEFEMSGRAA